MKFLIGNHALHEGLIVKLLITGVIAASLNALSFIKVEPGVFCTISLFLGFVSIVSGADIVSGAVKPSAGLVLEGEVDCSGWGGWVDWVLACLVAYCAVVKLHGAALVLARNWGLRISNG